MSKYYDPRTDIGLPQRKRVKKKKCYAAPGVRHIGLLLGKRADKNEVRFNETYNIITA